MKFPATSDQLKRAGYEYSNEARCKGPNCGEMIEWWITPNDKKMPLSVRKEGNVLFNSGEVREPHHMSCPDAPSFKGKH